MCQDVVDETSIESLNIKTNTVTLEFEEDIIHGLYKLKRAFGFPIEAMIAQSLRPFIDTLLPLAVLHEQGKLDVNCLADIQNAIETMLLKVEASKSRLDKKVTIATKLYKNKDGG